MNKVKQQIHYCCDDTMRGKVKGQNITVAVLDTGECVIILSSLIFNLYHKYLA